MQPCIQTSLPPPPLGAESTVLLLFRDNFPGSGCQRRRRGRSEWPATPPRVPALWYRDDALFALGADGGEWEREWVTVCVSLPLPGPRYALLLLARDKGGATVIHGCDADQSTAAGGLSSCALEICRVPDRDPSRPTGESPHILGLPASPTRPCFRVLFVVCVCMPAYVCVCMYGIHTSKGTSDFALTYCAHPPRHHPPSHLRVPVRLRRLIIKLLPQRTSHSGTGCPFAAHTTTDD